MTDTTVKPAAPTVAARTRILLEGPNVPTMLRIATPNLAVNVILIAVTASVDAHFVGYLGLDALTGLAQVFTFLTPMQQIANKAMGGGLTGIAVVAAPGLVARGGAPDRAFRFFCQSRVNAMPLQLTDHVDLPAHKGSGGFDHAAVHAGTGHVYVAHTANSAVDVLDPVARKHLYSIPGLTGVAGALVSDESQLVFVSNRGENTIGVFAPVADPEVTKIAVGVRPNGLAYDAGRRLVLAANVGDPAMPLSYTLSVVDLDARALRASIEVAGRTRWTVFDAEAQAFYVNIAQPSQIAVVDAREPHRVARTVTLPADGAHGLDFDPATRRLFCACDAGVLVTLDAGTGKVLDQARLSGVPDVVWFNPRRRQLYVAVGDPGVVDVFDTTTMKRLGIIATEKGAHTSAFPPAGDTLIAFLPQTHRAAIYSVL